MSSVTLQNNVRLRVILILTISLLIQLCRPWVSTSVHKITVLLEFNGVFYGMLLLCSCIPSKTAWYIAGIALVMSTFISGTVLTLGAISTLRCFDKSGCVQTVPGSVLVLLLVALQCGLDLYQTWNVYLILRAPYFVASSTQRLVILISWAFPFTILTNSVLFSASQWTLWVAPPLVAMPIVIIMAQSSEYTLIGLLLTISIVSNALALTTVTNSLARSAVLVQAAISLFGAVILFVPSAKYVRPVSPSLEKEPVLPVVLSPQPSRQKGHLRNRRGIDKSKMLRF